MTRFSLNLTLTIGLVMFLLADNTHSQCSSSTYITQNNSYNVYSCTVCYSGYTLTPDRRIRTSAGMYYIHCRQQVHNPGTNVDINRCDRCVCTSPLVYYDNITSSGIQGYYSCTTGCNSDLCYLRQNLTVSGNPVFTCRQCERPCLTCVNFTYCLTCTNDGYFIPSNNTCRTCSSKFGSGCNTCNLTHCISCYSNSPPLNASKTSDMLNYCTYCSSVIPYCLTCEMGPVCTACYSDSAFNLTSTLPQKQCLRCTTYLANCNQCEDGPTNCTKCYSGYVFDTSSPNTQKPCVRCSSSIPFCGQCSDGPVCTMCQSDAYFNLSSTLPQKQCVRCSFFANCQTCSNGPICTACRSGYVLNTSSPETQNPCVACSLISNCALCADGPVCTQCTSGMFRNLSSALKECYPCSIFPNCLTCANGPICTSCLTGYALNTTSTVAQQTCVSCSAISGCNVCADGPICLQCQVGYFANLTSTIKECYSCSIYPNCEVCNDGPICQSCVQGYHFNLSSTLSQKPCVSCISIPYCASCTQSLVCSSCVTNAYFNLTSTLTEQQCIPCTIFPNCSTCVDGPKCLTCITNHYFDLSVIAPDYKCVPCSFERCAQCIDGPTCRDCENGYFLNSSITPKPLCFACSTIPNCTKCMTHQPLCTQCTSGNYFINETITKACGPCKIKNCQMCGHGIICIQCDRNYIFRPSRTNESCEKCMDNQYAFQNKECKLCSNQIPQCTTCYHTGIILKCVSCQQRASIDQRTFKCINCSKFHESCVQCTSETCSKCEFPFKVGKTGKCDCQNGFDVLDNLCIKPIGCQISTSNYTQCTVCFSEYNFLYEPINKTCVCRYGYKLTKINRLSVCQAECGNGITSFPDQECDDGNLRDGDGCSKNCKMEEGFSCTIESPSQCTLNLNIDSIKHNYVNRIQGENRCRFSFSIKPFHPVYELVDWSSYLALNLTDEFMIKGSQRYGYVLNSNEITLEFDYRQTIENISAKAVLSFNSDHSTRLLEAVVSDFQFTSFAPRFMTSSPKINSIPETLFLEITIRGTTSQLTFDDESLLAAYKSLSVGYLAITITITFLFLIGSYLHKMIGLQTIQILQYVYVITMIVENQSSVKPLSTLKYSAFGGYSNYQILFGDISVEAESITYATVHKNFANVGLMRYFLMNVNFPLVLPIIALILYGIMMIRKFIIRSKYMKIGENYHKDQYTTKTRSTQWVYDHLVFPLVNLFSLISFFCTILYLQSVQNDSQINLNDSTKFSLIEGISFSLNLLFVMLTFFIISYEIFISKEQFLRSRMTESERNRVPKSMIEKLEHDENNPDRQNYKPWYVLVYILYYLSGEISLMLITLNDDVGKYGMELMLGLSGSYFLLVFCCEPYYKEVNFHNRAIKYNHLIAFVFTLTCELMKVLQMSSSIKISLVFTNLGLLIIMCMIEAVRFRVEYKFRKDLMRSPDLLREVSEIKKPQKNENDTLNKKQKLLLNNKFSFNNQMNEFMKKNNMLKQRIVEDDEQSMLKMKKMILEEFIVKYQEEMNEQNFINGRLKMGLSKKREKRGKF